MELCIDNPREGFADLFATHPSVDSRVQALVQYAGGHDSGRLALPSDTEGEADDGQPGSDDRPPPPPRGPWSDASAAGEAAAGTAQGASPAASRGPSRDPWAKPV